MNRFLFLAVAAAAASLSACGGGGTPLLAGIHPVTGAVLSGACADLKTKAALADTTITDAKEIAAGTLTIAGQAVPAHCQVLGTMLPRVSPVDGKSYAIKFEMRLPLNWNGRYFYQANGGIDGSVGV